MTWSVSSLVAAATVVPVAWAEKVNRSENGDKQVKKDKDITSYFCFGNSLALVPA